MSLPTGCWSTDGTREKTAEGEIINSLLLLQGLPFGTHGFLSTLVQVQAQKGKKIYIYQWLYSGLVPRREVFRMNNSLSGCSMCESQEATMHVVNFCGPRWTDACCISMTVIHNIKVTFGK